TLGSVTVAVADPANLSALDDLAFMTSLKVVPAIAPPSIIRRAIDRYYESTAASGTIADVLSEVEAEAAEIEVIDCHEASGQGEPGHLRAAAPAGRAHQAPPALTRGRLPRLGPAIDLRRERRAPDPRQAGPQGRPDPARVPARGARGIPEVDQVPARADRHHRA